MNDDARMKRNWEVRREFEDETRMQKQQTVAQIEKLEQPLFNLFRDITNIRNFIEECKTFPMVTNENIDTMEQIQEIFDGMNKEIIIKVIPLIDKLGLKPNMNQG